MLTQLPRKKVVGRFCHCHHSDNGICNLYRAEVMAVLLECGETNWITLFLKHTGCSTNERVVIVEEQKCRNIYVMPTFLTSYLVVSNPPFLSRNASLSMRLFLVVYQLSIQWLTLEFCSGGGGWGFQQIQLRTEDGTGI